MPLSEKIQNFFSNKNFQYVLIGLGVMFVTVSASYFSIGASLKGAASLTPQITAPTNLTATASSGTITFTWTPVANDSASTTYQFYRTTNSSPNLSIDQPSGGKIGPLSTFTLKASDITPYDPTLSYNYYFVVSQNNGDQTFKSGPSNMASVPAETPASSSSNPTPTPVAGLTCSGVANGSKVTWTANSTGAANDTMGGTPPAYLWVETDGSGNKTKKAESNTNTTTIDYGTTTGIVSISPVVLNNQQKLFISASPCSATISPAVSSQTQQSQTQQTQTQDSQSQVTKAPELPSTAALSCSGQQVGSNTNYTINWSATLKGVTDPTKFQYLWTGDVTDAGYYDSSGNASVSAIYQSTQSETKTAKIVAIGNTTRISATCGVNINFAASAGSTTSSSSNSGSTSSSSSGSNGTVVPLAAGQTSPSAGTGSSSSNQATALLPAQDVISCKMYGSMIVVDQNSVVKVLCTQSQNTIVNGGIFKGAFDPKSAKGATQIRKLFSNQSFPGTSFSAAWDGNSDYDSPVDDGDYSFVVWGAQSANYDFDYSVFKLKVFNKTADANKAIAAGTTSNATAAVAETAAKSAQAPVSAPTTKDQHASADAYTNQVLPTQDANVYKTAPAVPSKCIGVNYPTDIAGHWAEAAIKKAYDLCLVKGYADGTFHPDEQISRFAALKTLMIGRGIKPASCYNNSCGTPFTDINIKQSPYVRQAWKLNLAQGVTPKEFKPAAPLSRAQGAVLIAKFFKVNPFPANNCFTYNCGAGHPDNFFMDIIHPWQGPYIRAITDAGYMHGAAPNEFQPDRAMTRAEFIKSLFKTN